MQFLNSMSRGWNISLFHYRNHGADYGRVLVGHAGAAVGQGRVPRLPRPARLRLRRRDGQSRLPDVPRALSVRPSPGAAAPATFRAGVPRPKTCLGVAEMARNASRNRRFRQALCSSQARSRRGKLGLAPLSRTAARRAAAGRAKGEHVAGAESAVGRQGDGDRRFEHHSPQRRDLPAAGGMHGDPGRGRLRRAGQDRRPPARTWSSSTS